MMCFPVLIAFSSEDADRRSPAALLARTRWAIGGSFLRAVRCAVDEDSRGIESDYRFAIGRIVEDLQGFFTQRQRFIGIDDCRSRLWFGSIPG